MAAYYNDNNAYAAAWLRNLITAGHLPPGDVDERSIVDVAPEDLRPYRQCHFFAGIGGWSYATRLAGWPDARPIWTGSPPCQPWSIAGNRAGASDARHLWPELFRLASAARPSVLVGEQVADAAGRGWLDGVAGDMEGIGYACRAVVLPACSVGAFHRRDRIYFVADAGGEGLPGAKQSDRREPGQEAAEVRAAASERDRGSPWGRYRQQRGADGLARMVEPGVRLLAHGIPARVDRLGAFGNAIVPQVAAEILGAYLDCRP